MQLFLVKTKLLMNYSLHLLSLLLAVKSRRIIIVVLTSIAVGFIYSCVKKPTYSSTPLIKYNNVFRYGHNQSNPDSIEVAINFEDEEGDVGLEQSDTFGIFKNGNLFLVYYYDSANVPSPYHWLPYDATSPPLPPFDTTIIVFRVPPVLPPNETSQPMKGTIYAKLKKNPFIALPGHKIIKYKIYLYDKAMHKSNTIDTDPIIFQ